MIALQQLCSRLESKKLVLEVVRRISGEWISLSGTHVLLRLDTVHIKCECQQPVQQMLVKTLTLVKILTQFMKFLHVTAKCWTWCALSAHKIIKPVFFGETICTANSVNSNTVLQRTSIIRKKYDFLIQDNAMTHVANFSVASMKEAFGKQLITRKLWLPRSRDTNMWNIVCGRH